MSGTARLPYSEVGEGVRLTVRVTPRASRSAAGGLVEIGEGRSALPVRLAAPPVDGAANRALIAFLADRLGVAPSSIRIVAGERARVKTVAIARIAAADLAPLLAG